MGGCWWEGGSGEGTLRAGCGRVRAVLQGPGSRFWVLKPSDAKGCGGRDPDSRWEVRGPAGPSRPTHEEEAKRGRTAQGVIRETCVSTRMEENPEARDPNRGGGYS